MQGWPHPHLPTGQVWRDAPLPAACLTVLEEGWAQLRQGAPCSDSASPSVDWDVYLTSNSCQIRSCLGSPALNSHISVFWFFTHRLRGTLLLCQCPKFHTEHPVPLNPLSADCGLSACHYRLFALDSAVASVHLTSTAHKEEKQPQQGA